MDRTTLIIIICTIAGIQYILATFALVKLFNLKLSKSKCIIWDIYILIGILIGPVSFFIYYYIKRQNQKKSKNVSDKVLQ